MLNRNIRNHRVNIRPGQMVESVGGSVAKVKTNQVNPKVNLTNGIVGMNTVQNYAPKIKESPVYKAPNKSILADFKNLSFNSKKKKNIKLTL